MHFLVRLEQHAFKIAILFLLARLNLLNLRLHEDLVLLDLPRHLLEEGIFTVEGYIENCLFKLRQTVIVSVKVVLHDDHAFSISLGHLDYGLE